MAWQIGPPNVRQEKRHPQVPRQKFPVLCRLTVRSAGQENFQKFADRADFATEG